MNTGNKFEVSSPHKEYSAPVVGSGLVNTDSSTVMIPNPTSITQMYPPVPIAMLLSGKWQQRFRDLFVESGEFQTDPFLVLTNTERRHTKCVSVSLFKKNVNNRFANEFPLNEESWRTKYWDGLLRLLTEMPHFKEWKLRIYLENDLWNEASSEFINHPQVELYKMAVNSIGASPGMLWRFMALADSSLEIVLETDVDEPLTVKLDRIRCFEMDKQSAIGRIGGFTSNRDYYVAGAENRIKNYATMIGSCNMARPSRFTFDIRAAMRGFMAHRKFSASTDRPWAYTADEMPSVYNQPIGNMIYGWGSHWHAYGFDERFLKHVIYYHFASRGLIQTWAPDLPPWDLSPEGICDLEYVQSMGNVTICPQNAIRFESMELSQDALRIALLLEEHRWIFETLLQIMKKYSERGYCGNIFFHNIADPYFRNLVPKQLNLFKAALHASKALEIGFNAGHSTAIMLLANPTLQVKAFDFCAFPYTLRCLDLLNAVFSNRITLVKGPSTLTVPRDIECAYDLVHIDSNHNYDSVTIDLSNALPKCLHNAIIVMDDYEGMNDVARATSERKDLILTEQYTMHKVFPGSSHAIFNYCPADNKPG